MGRDDPIDRLIARFGNSTSYSDELERGVMSGLSLRLALLPVHEYRALGMSNYSGSGCSQEIVSQPGSMGGDDD